MMPSVRYAPTGRFSQHASGAKLEQIRFIIINEDSNSVFCLRNLSAHFGCSEKLKPYRLPQPHQGNEEVVMGILTGTKYIDSPVVSGVNRPPYAGIEELHVFLQTPARTNKGIGGQGQNGRQNKEQKGMELLMKIHSCYHQSQVSNISKFVCWSHGPIDWYTPEIALLFKEGSYFTTKFDWKQRPCTAVFVCNGHGGVDKLVFGDKAVSGIEFVSLGSESFISLIPSSGRADQILDILMDKSASETQRPLWDADSAIISSSQSSDDERLVMKSNKTSWTGLHTRQTDFVDTSLESRIPTGQLVRTGENGVILHPTNLPHRTLTWLPSKIPTQMASKVASFFPGGISRGTRYMRDKDLPLVPVVSTVLLPIKTIAVSLGKLRSEESNKFKKARERLPGLSRMQPTRVVSEQRSTQPMVDSSKLETNVDLSGNVTYRRLGGKTSGGQALIEVPKGYTAPPKSEKVMDNMYIPKFITDGTTPTQDVICNTTGIRAKKSKLGVSETTDSIDDNKRSSASLNPSASRLDLRTPDTPYVLRKKRVVPSDTHPSKLDLRGLPYTCVRFSDPSASAKLIILPTTHMTPPYTPTDEYPDSEDPVFKGCKVQRGFNPVYPNDTTPKKEFENRVGGLKNWFTYPMVQVAREYLPEGMKDTDWSWTDNDVSGEFIPGGIAW